MNSKKLPEKTIEDLSDEGYKPRTLTGIYNKIFIMIGVVMAIYHIYYLGYSSLQPQELCFTHLGFGLTLAFIVFPFSKYSNQFRPTLFDLILIIFSIIVCAYFATGIEAFEDRMSNAMANKTDFWLAIITIILVLEMTRRSNGWILPLVALIFILYGAFGHLLPEGLGQHRYIKLSRLIPFLMGSDALLSTPLSTSAQYVYLLFLFSSFLACSGAGQFFIDFSQNLAGGSRGGPAKVAVIGSALFGMISGSSQANVVASGTFTIPMMIKTGYSPRFSAAVESVSSTGGQLTPPILGAAAFLIAEITGTPYMDVCLASLIPAILYFSSIYYMIDLEAFKLKLVGIENTSKDALLNCIIQRGHLILPIVVLVFCMTVLGSSIVRSALYALYSTVLFSYLRKDTRIGLSKGINGVANGAKQAIGLISACATAGIIIGVLYMTGMGVKFAGAVINFADGSVPIALFLTMCASIVLGMGLPTAAAYLVCAAVVSPALTRMGIPALTSHMFIFYFACLSAITPPVALAAFTASFIAKSNPMSVAFTAMRLGLIAFIIPYMFVYAPALLFQGTAIEILITIITALVGVVFLGASLQGVFYNQYTPMPARILFLVAALTLIIPGYITDTIGIGAGLLAWGIQILYNRKIKHTAQV